MATYFSMIQPLSVLSILIKMQTGTRTISANKTGETTNETEALSSDEETHIKMKTSGIKNYVQELEVVKDLKQFGTRNRGLD